MPSKRQRQSNQKRNMRGGVLLSSDKDQIIKLVDDLKTDIQNMPVTEPVVANTEEVKSEVDKSVVTDTEVNNTEGMPGGRKKSQKRKQRKNRKSQRRQKRR